MGSARFTAALLLATAPVLSGPVAAQGFPGDAPVAAAFPAAVSLHLSASWNGDRSIRTYGVGSPNPNDPACDTIAGSCHEIQGLAGAAGLGARFQFPISPRLGLRAGLSYSSVQGRIELPDGQVTRLTPEKSNLLRAEALFVFRLKPHVPVFFGLGGAVARFNPGPSPGQDVSTEFGAVVAAGYDHRFPAPSQFGLRLEWTAYFMIPDDGGAPSEFEAKGMAFDNQLSVGVMYYLGGK